MCAPNHELRGHAPQVQLRRDARRDASGFPQGGGGYTSDNGAQTDADDDSDEDADLGGKGSGKSVVGDSAGAGSAEQARQEAKTLMSRLAVAEQQRDEATAKLREEQRGAGGQARAQRLKSGPRK